MTLTISTPAEIEHPLYEGRLEFTSEAIAEVVKKHGESTARDELLAPAVRVGQPQWWNLTQLAREKDEKLPAELSLLLRDADFYMLLLACTFQPERDSQIGWARFTAQMEPVVGADEPIAFDIYPREVYDETKRDAKLSVAPNLKFAGFELSLGEAVMSIESVNVEPVVIGYGALESAPQWQFEMHGNRPIQGSKFSYLIVKKPRSAEAVRLTLDLTADVVTQHGWLSARVTRRHGTDLCRVVCTE